MFRGYEGKCVQRDDSDRGEMGGGPPESQGSSSRLPVVLRGPGSCPQVFIHKYVSATDTNGFAFC